MFYSFNRSNNLNKPHICKALEVRRLTVLTVGDHLESMTSFYDQLCLYFTLAECEESQDGQAANQAEAQSTEVEADNQEEAEEDEILPLARLEEEEEDFGDEEAVNNDVEEDDGQPGTVI
jgi:hypothetical protein